MMLGKSKLMNSGLLAVHSFLNYLLWRKEFHNSWNEIGVDNFRSQSFLCSHIHQYRQNVIQNRFQFRLEEFDQHINSAWLWDLTADEQHLPPTDDIHRDQVRKEL